MANSMPSLLALLGLVAVAGYQNRDKIAEAFESARQRRSPDAAGPSGGVDHEIESQPSLAAGLSELIDRFKSSGQGESADSWVSSGPNRPIGPMELESAIGEETLAELSSKTGLTRAELIERLSTSLPDAVDRLTPDGRVPSIA